jgi:tetratricopeptide (TPR) repeat protein
MARYRMLETVREYSQQRRLDQEEAGRVERAHRDWVLALALEAYPQLYGPEQAAWLTRLETEHDNLRAALAWSLQCPDDEGARAALRLCGVLEQFWEAHGHLQEGRQWCAVALASEGAKGFASERARVLSVGGRLAFNQGEYDFARIAFEKSLALYHEIGSRQGIAAVQMELGHVAHVQGEYPTAWSCYTQSLAIFREINSAAGIASLLTALGRTAAYQGDYVSASNYHQEGLAIRRERGDSWGIGSSLLNLGLMAYYQGDDTAAWSYYDESLIIHREIGERSGMAYSLGGLGDVALARCDREIARTYYEQCLANFREIGDRSGIAYALHGLGNVAMDRGDYILAGPYLAESLTRHRDAGDRTGIAGVLEGVARLRVAQRAWEHAARLWGAAEALREAIGAPLPPVSRQAYERETSAVRNAMTAEAFEAAWTQGREMSREEAVAFALNANPDLTTSASAYTDADRVAGQAMPTAGDGPRALRDNAN